MHAAAAYTRHCAAHRSKSASTILMYAFSCRASSPAIAAQIFPSTLSPCCAACAAVFPWLTCNPPASLPQGFPVHHAKMVCNSKQAWTEQWSSHFDVCG